MVCIINQSDLFGRSAHDLRIKDIFDIRVLVQARTKNGDGLVVLGLSLSDKHLLYEKVLRRYGFGGRVIESF
jgi:hypothetical protein